MNSWCQHKGSGHGLSEFIVLLYRFRMGYLCAVKGCGHNTARDSAKFSFFRFPAIRKKGRKDIKQLCEERRREWFKNVFRKKFNDKDAENSRICSTHFISGKLKLK